MKDLIDKAIDASIDFEELMDQTDFDSWLDGDNSIDLEDDEQDITPFNEYTKSEEKLENICSEMMEEGSNELPKKSKKRLKDIYSEMKEKGSNGPPEKSKKELEDIYSEMKDENYLIFRLFESKNIRIEARKCFDKEEKEKYETAIHYLLSALTVLQNLNGVNTETKVKNKKWEILLYNDLSICYAGLENSSMSMGYAEESKKIIQDKKYFTYKDFFQKINADNIDWAEILNHEIFSSGLYHLYTVALYNQATAQGRSDFYSDAEKNFWKIIRYAELKENSKTPLCNYNYYSALLSLSDLYIELGRGKEAINLLNKIKEDENDIRYWNACITEIHALIDQSRYDEATQNLYDKNIFEKGNYLTSVKKHRITSTGFKGLNCFVRCAIEIARDDLKEVDETKIRDLNNATPVIERKIEIMSKRKQKGYKLKAYRQLSDIYIILNQNEKDKDKISDNDEKIISYLVKYISEEDNIDNLNVFIRESEQMGNWVDNCNDLDTLESFTDQVIKVITDSPTDKFNELFEKLKRKIIEEGEKKGQPARAKRIVRKIHVVIDKDYAESMSILLEKIKKKIIKEDENKGQCTRAERIVRKIIGTIKEKDYKEFSSHLIYEDICKRLDINEQEFDKALFERSEIKDKKHIAEVIILRRWNSFSPGLFRESTGSLGGGYLLRIIKYSFSFSDLVAKENERQKLLKLLHDLGLAMIMEGAKYSEEEEEIRITRNNKRIATLKIKEGLCYLECDNHNEIKIGVVKEVDYKKYIYSADPDVENIVIDPGYNFIQSFRNEGFHVEDIDTIIITHSHLDHCAELLSVMDLIFQFNKRYEDTLNEERQKKKVNLYLSQGAYIKFSNYINDSEWNRHLKDVIIIENLEDMKCDLFDGLTISAIQTPHIDLGGAHSIGIKINIIGEKKNLCFGFTSDTPWDIDIKKYFEECDLLCVHLGSMKYPEIGYKDERYNPDIMSREISSEELDKELRKTYNEANHLLFHGTLDFIESWSDNNNPLIIVGEFGEELKYGLRTDICDELTEKVNKNRNEKEDNIVCLPGDIGLYIGIMEDGTKKVRCCFCEGFIEQKEIGTFSYGREDAIHYICKTCDNTLTELQKQAVIDHRITRH